MAAPSRAQPAILDFLLNHFVLPKYNWNKMQRGVRCSVGWHNSPALFLLALRTLAGNLVQSKCHQWLRCTKETSGTRSKCREVCQQCICSSQMLGIISRSHQELLVYPTLGKQSEQWKSQCSTALWAFFPPPVSCCVDVFSLLHTWVENWEKVWDSLKVPSF